MIDDQITADFSELIDQASRTTSGYMHSAIHDIDRSFGDGYSADHPELVAAYIQSSSIDFIVSSGLKVLQGIESRLRECLNDNASNISSRLDEISTSFDGIDGSISSLSESVQSVAAMIDLKTGFHITTDHPEQEE